MRRTISTIVAGGILAACASTSSRVGVEDTQTPGSLLTLGGERARAVRYCYHQGVSEQPELRGRLHLRVVLDGNGVVSSTEVLEDTLRAPAVLECVLREIDAEHFEGAQAGDHRLMLELVVPKTIAAVPFSTAGGADLAWLSSMAADQIVERLAHSSLFVPVERLKLADLLNEQALGQTGVVTEESAIEVGKVLGAELMVVGSFAVSGQQLIISARVVETEDGKVLESASVTGEAADPMAAAQALADLLVRDLTKSGQASLREPRTLGGRSRELLAHLGTARNALQGLGAPADYSKAVAYYRKALTIGPGIAEAHLGLAEALWRESSTGEALDECIGHLNEATRLNGELYTGWLLLAYLASVKGDDDLARDALGQATGLAPSHPHTHLVACGTLSNLGVYDEALWSCRDAQLLLPKEGLPFVVEFLILGVQGRWDEAREKAIVAASLEDPWLDAHRAWVVLETDPAAAIEIAQKNITAVEEKLLKGKWSRSPLSFEPTKLSTGNMQAEITLALTAFGLAMAQAKAGDAKAARDIAALVPMEQLNQMPFFRTSKLLTFYLGRYREFVGDG